MTRNRTSTGWMGKLRRRRRALQHGPKAHATDVAAIAIGEALGLPLDEMEYTTMPAVAEKLSKRWEATDVSVPTGG